MHGVRLVQLKHSNISVKLAAEGHLAQQCRGNTAHKVRTGAVSENLQTLSFKQLHSHLRGGGLTVRAGDNNHAVGQLRELFSDEVGVQFFHDKAGEGGAAAAKLSRGAYALAEKTNEGFGHAYHFSTRTPAAEWPAGLVRSCRTGRQTAVLEQRALHPHPRELLRRLHQHVPPRGSIHQERRVSIAGVSAQKLTRRTRTEETSRPALQTRITRR